METTHRKSGYGPVSLIRDRTVTVIDEMNDLGETLLVRAILITGEAVASWPACNSGYRAFRRERPVCWDYRLA